MHWSISNDEWLIHEDSYNPQKLNKFEALFALSNGAFGVRACLEEMPKGTMLGTYLGGVFDRGESYTPDMVNLPNFQALVIVFEGQKFSVETCKVLEHKRILDMKQGLLYRSSKLQTPAGQILNWQSCRFISMVRPYLYVEKHTLVPENFSGTLSVTTTLNADTDNFDTHLDLKVRHYDVQEMGIKNNDLFTYCKLYDSRYPLTVAAGMVFSSEQSPAVEQTDKTIKAAYSLHIKQGEAVTFDRFSSAQSFLNHNEKNLLKKTLLLLEKARTKGFDNLLKEHTKAIAQYWNDMDILIEGDDELQKNIRFNIFELMLAGPRHNERSSIGARGLTGELYRGHMYWDTDLFMHPFYVYQDPASARSMAMYRYHTLDGARRNSARNYTKGARYPIQSADTGDEAGPVYDVDSPNIEPRIGRLGEAFRGRIRLPWLEREEIQITACVIYSVVDYYKATGDKEFMLNYGLEVLAEVARYWCSRMEWIEKNKRYELLRVVGGDEIHIHANNNAYTNYMVWFNLDWAIKEIRNFSKTNPRAISALKKKINLTDSEIRQWAQKQKKLYLPQPNKDGIIEQQDGWLKLKPFEKTDLDAGTLMNMIRAKKPIPNRFGGVVRCDGIFAASEYQLVKQCDLIILFWLYPDLFSREIAIKNYDFYEKQTVHMSSLSPNTSAIVGSRFGRTEPAYKNLSVTATVDLADYQNNGQWGLHYAAIGGTWMAMIFGFGGLCVTKDFKLELKPVLYKKWKSFKYRFFWHTSQVEVYYDASMLQLKLLKGNPIKLCVAGQNYTLKDQLQINYKNATNSN
ncbi:MAG: glycoside hydrolase family 65 protein [Sedimentisphaerales bacterium]|nr:glycoside hydrolase family 65 protein [Sedimentisphaerales bacterium]